MLAERFNQLHEQFYRFKMEGTTCEIVNLRAMGYGDVPKPRLSSRTRPGAATRHTQSIDENSVYFGGEWLPTKIYDRAKLVPGNRIEGPAIVTEFDSTTVVLAGHAAEIDRYLNTDHQPDVPKEA